MARLNLIIRAFEAHELQMLSDVMTEKEQQSIEEGIEICSDFHELKEHIHRANKYVNSSGKEHIL